MDFPLAYCLTWHTYGSRLHGDAEGTVDYAHRDVNTPVLGVDAEREAESRGRMSWPAVVLDPAMREGVVVQVLETCGVRGRELRAVHARTSHVHGVVSAAVNPEKVLADLKAYTTRRLRSAGLLEEARPAWSEHGSTRYLWDAEAVKAKVRYTLEDQGRPMARWPANDSYTEHEA